MASRHRFQLGDANHVVVVDEVAGGLAVTIDDAPPILVDATAAGVPGLISMIVDQRPSRAYVSRQGQGYRVTVEGRSFDVTPVGAGGRQRGAVGGASDPPGKVSAPLAGVVMEVRVAVGDTVTTGQSLVVIEAMKMQNEVQAPRPGTVTAIRCEKGGRVERGELLVEYDVTAD
jgi:biotin carboxyl carrier protein